MKRVQVSSENFYLKFKEIANKYDKQQFDTYFGKKNQDQDKLLQEYKMGVDFDFKSHINKTKLTASQFEQPVNELDMVTQSTEANDLLAILQILNAVQGRLRQRFDVTQQLVSLMVEMSQDRRFFITFMGRRQEGRQEGRINDTLLNRPVRRMMPRVPRNLNQRIRQEQEQEMPRHRNFLQFGLRNDRSQQISFFERSIQMGTTIRTSTQSQTISQQLENNNEILPPILRQTNILELSILQHENQNPFEVDNNQNQRHERVNQHENNETSNKIHLNQNSMYPIRPKAIQKQQPIEQPTTCWQFLTRMVRNFFNIFR